MNRTVSRRAGFFALSLGILAVCGPNFGAKPALAQPATRGFLVCIDPGHPSETARGASANGLDENRLNWQVALRLQRRLNALGIASVMTKSRENQLVTNRRRAEIANENGAALMIRLHADAGRGSGFAWYYPNRAGRKYGVTGPPRHVQLWSREAAHTLNEAMKPILSGYLRANPIKTDAQTGVGGRQGGVLTGSIFSLVPTALIEMCFLTNRRDAQLMKTARGQEKMAEALAVGVVAWKRRWENRR